MSFVFVQGDAKLSGVLDLIIHCKSRTGCTKGLKFMLMFQFDKAEPFFLVSKNHKGE